MKYLKIFESENNKYELLKPLPKTGTLVTDSEEEMRFILKNIKKQYHIPQLQSALCQLILKYLL